MTVELDTALQLALRLMPAERLRLVELVVASVGKDLSMNAQTDDMSVVPTPQRPLAGNVSMPSPITVQGYHRPRQMTIEPAVENSTNAH
jgi:hypothetical protein